MLTLPEYCCCAACISSLVLLHLLRGNRQRGTLCLPQERTVSLGGTNSNIALTYKNKQKNFQDCRTRRRGHWYLFVLCNHRWKKGKKDVVFVCECHFCCAHKLIYQRIIRILLYRGNLVAVKKSEKLNTFGT